jgi:hypothetical protein
MRWDALSRRKLEEFNHEGREGHEDERQKNGGRKIIGREPF